MSLPHHSCPRCGAAVQPAPFCSQCGFSLATAPPPPQRRAGPVIRQAAIYLIIITALVFLLVRKGEEKPRWEVVWETLGPTQATGYLRNLTGETARSPFVRVWADSVPTQDELPFRKTTYPHWEDGGPDGIPDTPTFLPPGKSYRFTLRLAALGSPAELPYPVPCALSRNDPPEDPFPFIQRRATDPPGSGDTSVSDAAARLAFN